MDATEAINHADPEHDDGLTQAVPVKVEGDVLTTTRQAHTIVTEQVPVPAGQVTRILPRSLTRCRAVVNVSGGAAVIGGPGVTVGSGYPVTAQLEVSASAALYATAAADTIVCVYTEHLDG